MANEMRTKVNGGDARRDIFKAYFLARESTTDMSQAPLPFYAASRSCAPRCPARRVVGIGHMERLATWPGPVKISRFLLPQSFVRTLIVIIANPIPSAALLSRYRTGWWVSGVFFEDAVHLLVSRVIFRMSPPTELHFDSQAQPPKTQTRKAQRAHATEGRTVIHANHLRYAITSEQALAAGADGLVTLVVQQEDAQNVTTRAFQKIMWPFGTRTFWFWRGFGEGACPQRPVTEPTPEEYRARENWFPSLVHSGQTSPFFEQKAKKLLRKIGYSAFSF